MTLPEILRNKIEQEASRYPLEKLMAASEELTRRYRERSLNPSPFMDSDIFRIAYLVARMPATLGVIKRVLEELVKRMPNHSLNSILDLGSGPGTGLWAAASILPDVEQFTCLELDRNLAELGKNLLSSVEVPLLKAALWHTDDLRTADFNPNDLILISYAIGELSKDQRKQVIAKSWLAAKKAVIIIEPGTKGGFTTIRQAREDLIGFGAHIIAPCPHSRVCPMTHEDWCHFAERIERTSLHRKMKSGTLGYEDEKYSYVIAFKNAGVNCSQRILRHPLKYSGHLQMVLCTDEGIIDRTISKRDGNVYKKARKAEWGEGL